MMRAFRTGEKKNSRGENVNIFIFSRAKPGEEEGITFRIFSSVKNELGRSRDFTAFLQLRRTWDDSFAFCGTRKSFYGILIAKTLLRTRLLMNTARAFYF